MFANLPNKMKSVVINSLNTEITLIMCSIQCKSISLVEVILDKNFIFETYFHSHLI